MKKSNHKKILHSAGLCGVSAGFVVIVLFGIAVALSPSFSWENNALSDLGIQHPSGFYFNSGLIILGLMGIFVGRGLWIYIKKDLMTKFGMVCFFGGALMLFGLAVFKIDAGFIHYAIAALFFILVPAAMAAIGISEIRNKKRTGFFSLLFAIFSGIAWALPWSGRGIALPEIVSAVFMIAFCFLYGIAILRKEIILKY